MSAVPGPISSSLSTLALLGSIICSPSLSSWTRDPKVVPIPWRTVSLPGNLTIGVMRHDGIVRPHPPVLRALERVVHAVEKRGHEIVEFEPYDHQRARDIMQVIFGCSNRWPSAHLVLSSRKKCFLDGGSTSTRNLISSSGEPWPVKLEDYRDHHPTMKVHELWQVQQGKTDYMKEYLDHWMTTKDKTRSGRPVDFVLCPVMPYAAVPHGALDYAGYTGVWNGASMSVKLF